MRDGSSKLDYLRTRKKKDTVTLHNGKVTERKLVFSDINDREYCISIFRNTIRLINLNMYDTNALIRDKYRIAQAINTLKLSR